MNLQNFFIDELIPAPATAYRVHDLSTFKDSMKKVGQISPLIGRLCLENPNKIEIICGHGRLEAARQIGLEKLAVYLPMTPCVVDFSDFDLLCLAVHDNQAAHLSDYQLEKECVFATRLALSFGATRQNLHQLWDCFGKTVAKQEEEEIIFCAALPKEIFGKIATSDYGFETAKAFHHFGLEAAKAISLILPFQLRGQRVKEITKLLAEISLRDHVAPEEILSEILRDKIFENKDHPRTQKEALLCKKLLEKRNPRLSSWLAEAERKAAQLKLPPALRLKLPDFLEGERLEFNISAKSPGELAKLAEALKSAADSNEMAALFEMLGGGEG
jgi:hypothetical protein